MDKDKTLLIAAATTISAFSIGYLLGKSSGSSKDTVNDKFETYHLGIETGGTSCKVGIMKGKASLNIIKTNIIKTTTPEETV